MLCKKCGATLSEDSNFCVECGEAVDNLTESQVTQEASHFPNEAVTGESRPEEIAFQKNTMLGRITYKRISTKVSFVDSGLKIEKKTKKIFRKEKTEEGVIPFEQILSAQDKMALDFWDTMYGIIFTVIGILYNILFLIVAAVCFWTGYGRKLELTLASGKKYLIPYKFGKKESTHLVDVCNNIPKTQQN